MSDGQVPGVKIEAVTLSNGSEIPFVDAGVTAIVGGNNVGKSTLLRQIHAWAYHGEGSVAQPGQFKMISGVRVKKTDTVEGFWSWLSENAMYQRPTLANPALQEGYVRVGVSSPINRAALQYQWSTIGSGHFNQLAPFLLNYAEASGRAGNQFTSGRRARPGDAPTDPLHYLEDNPALLSRVVGLFEEVFGEAITLDKLGQTVCLRVGTPSPMIPPPGYGDNEIPFREELDTLPTLATQGDGMRSFLGLILPIVAATHAVILIDEPEAFLHPPQAVKLGRILGALAVQSGSQVVLATHDRNILVGLLESGIPLSVVRLGRKGNVTDAAQLEPERIRAIWSDPVLKYSHVLDGLFHRAVVLAENERDCTFYSAAMDAANRHQRLEFAPSELLYVPTGGKDGMPVVAAALAALRVPVIATPDIDMLDDSTKMNKIVTALGANWEEFRQEYEYCTQPFRVPRSKVLVAQVARHIESHLSKVLEEDPERLWDQELRDEILAISRSNGSPWEPLRIAGAAGFPRGVSHRAEQLLERFDAIGLVLVRVGDLEAFSKGFDVVERKGLRWLESALRKKVHEGDEAVKHALRIFNAALRMSGSA